jgi:hypothetical protein
MHGAPWVMGRLPAFPLLLGEKPTALSRWMALLASAKKRTAEQMPAFDLVTKFLKKI